MGLPESKSNVHLRIFSFHFFILSDEMRLEKIYEKYEVSEVYMLADSFQDLGKNVLNSCFYFQM